MFYTFIIFVVLLKSGISEDSHLVNVGTVLFTDSDRTNDCWNSENMALLRSRMMFEDMLPGSDVLIIKDKAFVSDIIDYLRLVLETVRKVTYGKTKHIMLLALTDLLGGYLHHLVIPIAKRAYYTGYIDFPSIEKLFNLQDEFKGFLRTDGRGWAPPIKEFGNNRSKKMDAQPLPIESPALTSDPCKGIIIYEIPAHGTKSASIEIPMPFFDSKTNPSSIAVPFKTYSLRSLESKSASYILVKFYITASKCLAERNANGTSVHQFNNNLHNWIHTQVLPRLNDDRFYSAFGGVLRLEETLARSGATSGSNNENGNIAILPETQINSFSKGTPEEESEKQKKSTLILMALLATIFIWFLLGSMFICYKIRASRSRKGECKCDKEQADEDPNHKESKTSSKMSRFSSKLKAASIGSHSKDKSSSTRTSRSKKSTSSSGPSKATLRGPSNKTIRSRAPTLTSNHSTYSDGSQTSGSLSDTGEEPSKGHLESRSGQSESPAGSFSSTERSIKSKLNKKSKKKGACTTKSVQAVEPEDDDNNSQRPAFYPPSCACHTSLTGKFRMTSSSEEMMKTKTTSKEPLVFGYELETSTESTPRVASNGNLDNYRQNT